MVTTLLELVGVGLLIATAYMVWWPAAMGVAGLACLVMARQREQSR